MNTITHLFVFLLLTIANTLQLTEGEPSSSIKTAHESSILSIVANHNYNYHTFLQFMHDINRLSNNAGFIHRTLLLNYNNQYPQLQTTFSEIGAGINAIKQSLINNNLLINSFETICPENITINKSEIIYYLNYTLQK